MKFLISLVVVLLVSCGEDSFLKQVSQISELALPFGSEKASKLYWKYETYPVLTINSILAVSQPGLRSFFTIPDSTEEYANSIVYQLGRLPCKDSGIVAVLYMYQDSGSQKSSIVRLEPKIDLVVHSNTGAIIDRLSLHAFDRADGFVSTSFEIDSAQTIRVSRLESSWDKTFKVNTQGFSIKEYRIDASGKFVQSKKEISIKLDDQDQHYKFGEYKIYESAWLNQKPPEDAMKRGTVSGVEGRANVYYHTWAAPVETIMEGATVMYMEMPALYGSYYLARSLGADDRLFWIRKDQLALELDSAIEVELPIVELDTNAGILISADDIDKEKARPAGEFPFEILGLDGAFHVNQLSVIVMPKYKEFEVVTRVEEGGEVFHFTLHILKSRKETSKGGLTVSPLWFEPWEGGDRKECQLVIYANYTIRLVTTEKTGRSTRSYSNYYRISEAGEFQEVRIQ